MSERPSGQELVEFEQQGPIAYVTLSRPETHNAQTTALLYQLDDQLTRAAHEESVYVVVLRGAGKSFSSGHDIKTKDSSDYSSPRTMWAPNYAEPGVETRLHREQEMFLGLTRRWRDLPKPSIAAVHGHCIGAGLMLAWACDLIIATESARFADPVVRMGIPGAEYFAHPFQFGPRLAKEILLLGEPIDAQRAHDAGMVNRVVPDDQLDDSVALIAERIAQMPRLATHLVKKSVNFAEDAMGLQATIDHAFGLHQLAHAHVRESSGGEIREVTTDDMRDWMGGS